jgi:hypothetical protein
MSTTDPQKPCGDASARNRGYEDAVEAAAAAYRGSRPQMSTPEPQGCYRVAGRIARYLDETLETNSGKARKSRPPKTRVMSVMKNWRTWLWLISLGIVWVGSVYLTPGDAFPIGIAMFAFGCWIGRENERAKARQRSGEQYFRECAELVRRYHRQECETPQTCQCAALASALDQWAKATALWVPYQWGRPEEWT